MHFIEFILGLVTSYIGLIPPSMLNLNAIKISIEKDQKTAIQFAFGVSLVVLIQAFLALLFLKKIHTNTFIIDSIQILSIIIFFILSIVFFVKALKEQKTQTKKTKLKNGFLTGIGLSFINMFSIPFYCGMGAIFNMHGWLNLNINSLIWFVVGTAIGTYLILTHYIALAKKIKPRLALITKYLNFILSAITGLVAIYSLIKIL